ncbi:MAG: hypothetical protein ACXVZW_05900 [Gaiellaceae bacterium]
MPGPEPDNSVSAGVSRSEPVDVERLVEQLQHELRFGGLAAGDEEGAAARRAALRTLAERFKAVSAERPFQRRGGPLGPFQIAAKKVLRKLMRWYVEPLAAEQRIFNDVALRLIDSLCEELEREAAGRQESLRRLSELELRLSRLGAGEVSTRTQP